MGFLRKIFGNLKSADPTSLKNEKRPWVARAPRVKVLPLHGVSFSFSDQSELGPQTVVNLSFEGMALARNPGELGLQQGSRSQGILRFSGQEFCVAFEVVHLGDRFVGGKFKELPANFNAELRDYFSAEFSGSKMREVNQELLQAETDGKPRFFLGENGCELFLVECEGQVLHFHAVFSGNYIEGGREQGVRAGVLEEEASKSGPAHKTARIVADSQLISENLAAEVVKFLSNVSGLDPLLHDSLVALLQLKRKS